jgi:hypothetical protein
MSVEVRREGVAAAAPAPARRASGLHAVPDAPAVTDPHVAPALAAVALVTELDGVVAAMAADGATPAHRDELDAVLTAWAQALVRTHRRRLTPFSPVAPLPWVLEDPLPAWIDELPAAAGPAWAVRAHPAVRQSVHRTLSSWTAVQWTHGAPTGDDVVLSPEAGGTWRAQLPSPIGRGDPRWDVATVLDWLAVALGPILEPVWRIDPGARFLTEYRAQGGDATPSRAMAVTRTLATAVEWSALVVDGSDVDDEDAAWLGMLWRRPLELVGAGRTH